MMASMPGHADVITAMEKEVSPVAIRLNPAKPLNEPIATDDKVAWEPNGCYLTSRPPFTFHPGLYDGRFYVQDPSAMILGYVVRKIAAGLPGPINYLDACAAPGGKTTSALSVLPEGSFVLANEFSPARVNGLLENMERWGVPGYAVSRNDARQFKKIGPVFDIVAADVPCSGEGMMRKNETAVTQWSPSLIRECADLQRDIVEAVWQALRPGGYLIYSTCTFNTSENERNAEWIRDSLGAVPVDLSFQNLPGVLPGIDTDIPCARFLPGKVRGEGQFIAVFRKPEDYPVGSVPKYRKMTFTPLPDIIQDGYVGVTNKNGDIYALNKNHVPILSLLDSKINLICPGVHIFSLKGSDFRPAHAFATSLLFSDDMFPTLEVDYPTAISYLRGDALRLDPDVPHGFVRIAYNGYNLGWVKNIGSRANNLFPVSGRIRSTHGPDSVPALL